MAQKKFLHVDIIMLPIRVKKHKTTSSGVAPTVARDGGIQSCMIMSATFDP